MDEERWQESLNARNTLAANQAIYAAWSAAWTAEATDNIINIYKHLHYAGSDALTPYRSWKPSPDIVQ